MQRARLITINKKLGDRSLDSAFKIIYGRLNELKLDARVRYSCQSTRPDSACRKQRKTKHEVPPTLEHNNTRLKGVNTFQTVERCVRRFTGY